MNSAYEQSKELRADLGIPVEYGTTPALPVYAEAADLLEAGANIIGRMQMLTPATTHAWHEMKTAAQADAIELLLVSGFRSFAYQADLIRNKIAKGQSIEEILEVNVAPGYSQHHTGKAMDIATPGSKPLLEEFEETAAFAWLQAHAQRFGFSMSYPRNNPEGVIYEPWHWYRSDDD